MSFLLPSAFTLALLIPIVIAMYLLKLKRTEQMVSSVYLWRRMVRDLEANAPWQRLQRNLLLILQLLFLVILILALARPFAWGEGFYSQALILIIDNSASMAAVDVSPNRLEAAKTQAQSLVDGLPEDARVTIITAGQSDKVLLTFSQDRRQIRQTIANIQVLPGGSDLTAALEIASAIAIRQPQTDVVVLSDGKVTIDSNSSYARQAQKNDSEIPSVRYLPQGDQGDNQAIQTFSLEENKIGSGLTVFIQIKNYSASPSQRRLALYVDGDLFNAYDLDVSPGGEQNVLVKDIPASAQIVEARLLGQDILTLDDRAWIVNRQVKPMAVTLVTPGNLFLETALALLPGVAVTTINPQAWEAARSGESQPTDLTVFDTYIPQNEQYPTGSLWFIAPPHSTPFFTVTDTINQPVAQVIEPDHPLMAYVNFNGINILDAMRIPTPDWSKTLITGIAGQDEIPLYFVGTPGKKDLSELPIRGEQRIAVLTFDLRRSDLPLRETFPLLVVNLVNWLLPGNEGGLPLQVNPGEVVKFNMPPEILSSSAVLIIRPDESSVHLSSEDGRVLFADTNQLGVYTVTWGETGKASFTVNLFNPQESDLKPAGNLPWAANANQPGNVTTSLQQKARHEFWWPLALAALLLLVAEWFVYYRATVASIFRMALGRLQ